MGFAEQFCKMKAIEAENSDTGEAVLLQICVRKYMQNNFVRLKEKVFWFIWLLYIGIFFFH